MKHSNIKVAILASVLVSVFALAGHDALLRQSVTRMERGPHIFKNEWLHGLTALGRPCC